MKQGSFNPTAKQVLVTFVLQQAEDQPLSKRVHLYRALAQYSGVPREMDALNQLADQLEAADLSCRQFVFDFTNATATAKPSASEASGHDGKNKHS